MNNFIKVFAFLALFFVQLTFINGQKSNDIWTRIESENKEISFAVPNNFSFFYDKEGFIQSDPKKWTETAEFKNVRSITAYQNGTTLFFESYNVKNAKKALNYLLSTIWEGKYQNISFENFSGLHIVSDKSSYNVFYYLASEKNIYLIGYGSREKTNETISEFLSTVKLNGKFVFNPVTEKVQESDKSISITDIQETPIEIVYNLGSSKEENKKKADKKIKETEQSETEKDNSKALIVTFKPRAMYTDEARMKQEQGLVRFKTNFLSNGLIGKITVIKDLRFGLTENAIKSLKRMRFLPAIKDGSPISSEKTVEYSFTIY